MEIGHLQAWEFKPSGNGDIRSLTCGPDLNQDGVEDCAVIMEVPFLDFRGRSTPTEVLCIW